VNVAAGALYFITGSSGAGKTTLLRRAAALRPSSWPVFHLDEHGVPSAAELEAAGGGWAWQRVQARRWAERAVRDRTVVVVEGQARPSDILAVAASAGVGAAHVTLIDCDHAARRRSLLEERGQPELDVLDTYAWAAYLRGQADALNLEIIDTTSVPVEVSSAALAASITRFAESF
jgi:energy-coupling factor transporter ATP-binding protein EcfA2